MDDQYLVGDSLLVKPVTETNQNTASVYLPPSTADWYDLETLVRSPSVGQVTVDAPLSKIPVFIRGGKVVPRKLRLRRSSKLMHYDPYTLVVAPDSATNSASGLLYLDDEFSLAHETVGAFAVRRFDYNNGELRCTRVEGTPESAYSADNTVERVVLAGQSKAPKKVTVEGPTGGVVDLTFSYDSAKKTVTVKKPDVRVMDNWVLKLVY